MRQSRPACKPATVHSVIEHPREIAARNQVTQSGTQPARHLRAAVVRSNCVANFDIAALTFNASAPSSFGNLYTDVLMNAVAAPEGATGKSSGAFVQSEQSF